MKASSAVASSYIRTIPRLAPLMKTFFPLKLLGAGIGYDGWGSAQPSLKFAQFMSRKGNLLQIFHNLQYFLLKSR